MIYNKNYKYICFYATLFLACATCCDSYAQTTSFKAIQPWQPRIEGGVKAGTERTIGVTEAWIPVAQNADQLVYSDIRWMADDNSDQEGNLGLGYRQLQADQIMGAHIWMDRRRTERGSNFYQITTGVEYFKDDWDVRANLYVPINRSKTYTTPNIGSTTPYLAGTGLYFDTNGEIREEAQPGGDLEFGYRLPIFEQRLDAVRLYAAGYHFEGNETRSVTGGRVRTSVDVNPWLNIGARFQYDPVRDGQGFLEATLRLPIAAKQRFQERGLRARMDESPERDIDIVTGAKVDTGHMKPVLNAQSGTQQRILHVDNTAAAGGDGSKEHPFNTLAGAQAALKDNDIVYVHSGDGTTTGMSNGITIAKNNIQFIGSGTNFVYDSNRFTAAKRGQTPTSGVIIEAATTAPKITRTGAVVNFWDAVVTVTGDNAMVTGFTIQGGANGVTFLSIGSSQTINQGYVGNMTLNGLGDRGFYALSIDDSVSHTSGHIGSLIFEDSVINHSTGLYGLVANLWGGGTIDSLTFRNNTVNQSQLWGSGISVASGSRLGTLTYDGNDINRTGYGQAGLYVEANSGSASVGGIIDHLNIVNNALTRNSGSGIELHALGTGSAINNINIDHNDVNTNSNHGVWLNATGTSAMTGALARNTVTANSGNGVYIDDDTTGTYFVSLGDATIANSGYNRIYSNNSPSGKDARVDADGATVKAENNWWGSSSGLTVGQTSLESGSTIDAVPYLTTDPGF